MQIGEFFIKLGVDADLPTVKNFAKAIGDLPIEVLGAVTALAALDYEFVHMAREAMDAAVALERFTSETGLSAQELQRWQVAAQQANVSAESVESAVTGLQQKIAQIHLTGEGIGPFTFLGINIDKGAFGVLEQLHRLAQNATTPEKIGQLSYMMSQMGVSPQILPLLQKSDEEFKRMFASNLGMTRQQEQSFLALKRSVVDVGLEVRKAGYALVQAIGPDAIRTIRIVGGATREMFTDLAGIWEFLDKIPHLFTAIIAIAAAIGAAFAPVTAAVVGLLLILDDVYHYAEGKPSLIGEISKNFKGHPELEGAFKGLPFLGPMAGMVDLGKFLGAGVANIEHNVTVHVHGTGSNRKILDDAGDVISKKIRNADDQVNNGGKQ